MGYYSPTAQENCFRGPNVCDKLTYNEGPLLKLACLHATKPYLGEARAVEEGSASGNSRLDFPRGHLSRTRAPSSLSPLFSSMGMLLLFLFAVAAVAVDDVFSLWCC